MSNQIVGLIFADGEIFSNLRLVQAMHDLLENEKTISQDAAMTQVTRDLIKRDGVIYELVIGEQLETLLSSLDATFTNETQLKAFLTSLYSETKAYAEAVTNQK